MARDAFGLFLNLSNYRNEIKRFSFMGALAALALVGWRVQSLSLCLRPERSGARKTTAARSSARVENHGSFAATPKALACKVLYVTLSY